MNRLLHIIASSRGADSASTRIARTFVERFQKEVPSGFVDELDLYREELPVLNALRAGGKYSLMAGQKLEGRMKEEWEEVDRHIRRFLSANVVLISTPMWNFSVPYGLKHYLDVIVQPGYLFRYTDKGPVGLVGDKKVVVVSTRGGDYGPDSPFRSYDLLEPYLRTVLSFIGVTDLAFVNAQPMAAAGEAAARKAEAAAVESLKTLPLLDRHMKAAA